MTDIDGQQKKDRQLLAPDLLSPRGDIPDAAHNLYSSCAFQ
jgi:hypothetical protein